MKSLAAAVFATVYRTTYISLPTGQAAKVLSF
jgi:hypothetical protein